MTTGFDRAQQAYDANTEPPEFCEHEEWESTNSQYVTSSTMDIEIFCTQCRISGSLDFNDEETISVNWNE